MDGAVEEVRFAIDSGRLRISIGGRVGGEIARGRCLSRAEPKTARRAELPVTKPGVNGRPKV